MKPQVARSRLLQRQQANARVIDIHIETIDIPIVLNDRLRQIRVPIHQRLHGTLNLLFYDRPHAQELLFELCEFLIEMALHGADVLPVTRNDPYVIFRPLVLRRGENRFGISEFNQLAQQKKPGMIGHPRGLLHVMGDDHHRTLILETKHQLLDLGGGNRIQGRARFIQKQNFRIDSQRARNTEPLLLAAGERIRRIVQLVLHFIP